MLWVLQLKRVLRRVLRRGCEKGLSRRCLERPFEKHAPLRRAPYSLTCFHMSFFPFTPFAGHPFSSPFSAHFRPFLPVAKCSFSVEQRALRRAWRGAVSGLTSPQSSGRKFLPEICVKKGQFRWPQDTATPWKRAQENF